MINTVIGKKIEQNQRFLEDGTRVPVTVVVTSDSPVIAIKTVEKDGYNAVQIGQGVKKKATKPMLGHVKKANLDKVPSIIKEVKLTQEASMQVGEILKVEEILKPGDIVKVTGNSKGKGFAGVVKRHNFKGGPRTHGQSDRERAPGSIGQTTTPGRVYRGKRMAGRMGSDTVTVSNLKIVDVVVDGDRKIVLIAGLVPGSVNSFVTIEKTGEVSQKKFVPLQKPAVVEIEEEKELSKEESVTEVSTEQVEVSASEESVEEPTKAQESEEKTVNEEEGK